MGRLEDRHNERGQPGGEPGGAVPPDVRFVLTRYAIVASVCLLLASLMAPPVVPAAFSAMMTFAAMAAVATALLRGEEVALAAMNRWDEAALFLLTSIVARWFVDMDALRAAAEGSGAS